MVEPCPACTDLRSENAELVDLLAHAHKENGRLRQRLGEALEVAERAARAGLGAAAHARRLQIDLLAQEG